MCFNRASIIYRCFHRENLQVLNDSAVIWQYIKKKKKNHSVWVSSCQTARVLLCYSEHHHFNNKVFVFGAAQSPSIVWSWQVGCCLWRWIKPPVTVSAGHRSSSGQRKLWRRMYWSQQKQREETAEFFFKPLKAQTISFLVCKQQLMKPDHFFGIKKGTAICSRSEKAQRAITDEQ